MRIVVDCSVAMAWAFQDEQSSTADDAMFYAQRDGAAAPPLWWWELSNTIRTATRRGRCSAAEALKLLANPVWDCVKIDGLPNAVAMQATINLALQYQLTVYDAAYLDLAIRLNCPLATLDKQLARAAREAGLPPVPTAA